MCILTLKSTVKHTALGVSSAEFWSHVYYKETMMLEIIYLLCIISLYLLFKILKLGNLQTLKPCIINFSIYL